MRKRQSKDCSRSSAAGLRPRLKRLSGLSPEARSRKEACELANATFVLLNIQTRDEVKGVANSHRDLKLEGTEGLVFVEGAYSETSQPKSIWST
jgi:hypothetical protein